MGRRRAVQMARVWARFTASLDGLIAPLAKEDLRA
jgi:hypothetical protein